MNNDFYAECLVNKAPTGGDTAKRILIGLGAAVLSAGAFLFLFTLSFVIIAGIFYGAYYLMTSIDTEYEYILTNGDFDIDKIIGKRKRKRLVSASIGDFTAFGLLSEAPDFNGTTVLASSGSGTDYYADFVHKTEGNVRLIFTPNEKILDGMELFLPRQLKLEFKKKRVRLTETESE
ncbi:MAG: hypothetical protein ACI4RH_03980 [Huintestinicola sp.]